MRKQFTKQTMEPNFETTLEKDAALGGGLDNAANLVRLITQVLDASIKGEDCYLSINCTRKKDSAIVTLTVNGDKLYASGTDWPSLLASVDSLL